MAKAPTSAPLPNNPDDLDKMAVQTFRDILASSEKIRKFIKESKDELVDINQNTENTSKVTGDTARLSEDILSFMKTDLHSTITGIGSSIKSLVDLTQQIFDNNKNPIIQAEGSQTEALKENEKSKKFHVEVLNFLSDWDSLFVSMKDSLGNIERFFAEENESDKEDRLKESLVPGSERERENTGPRKSPLTEAARIAGDQGRSLLQTFGDIVVMALGPLVVGAGLIQGVADQYLKVAKIIVKSATNLVTTISTVLATTTKAILFPFKFIISKMTSIQSVSRLIDATTKTILFPFKFIISKMRTVSSVISGIGKFFTATINVVSKAISFVGGLFGRFASALSRVGTTIGNVMKLFDSGLFGRVFTSARALASKFFWIINIGVSIYQGFQEFFKSLEEGNSILMSLWEGVKTALATSVSMFSFGILEVETLRDIFQNFMDITKSTFDFLVGLITLDAERIVSAWGGIKDGIASLWGGLQSLAEDLWGAITGPIADAVAWTMNAIGIGDTVRTLFSAISESVTNAITWIQETPTRVTDKITALFSSLMVTFQNAIDWVVASPDMIRDWVVITFNNILVSLSGLADQFASMIGDAVMSLVYGITDAIANFVDSNIPDMLGGGRIADAIRMERSERPAVNIAEASEAVTAIGDSISASANQSRVFQDSLLMGQSRQQGMPTINAPSIDNSSHATVLLQSLSTRPPVMAFQE